MTKGNDFWRMTETNLIAGFLNYPQRRQDLPRLLSPRHQELRGKAEAANLPASLRAGYSRTRHALWIELSLENRNEMNTGVRCFYVCVSYAMSETNTQMKGERLTFRGRTRRPLGYGSIGGLSVALTLYPSLSIS